MEFHISAQGIGHSLTAYASHILRPGGESLAQIGQPVQNGSNRPVSQYGVTMYQKKNGDSLEPGQGDLANPFKVCCSDTCLHSLKPRPSEVKQNSP